MSKSLGNVIDPLDIVYGASLPVTCESYLYSKSNYNVIFCFFLFQALESSMETSLKRGHLSLEEYKKALEEKRSKFPEGIPQTGADALRFTLCSYNVKSNF